MMQEQWASFVKHAEQLQENNFVKEIGRDEILKLIIVNMKDNDESVEELLAVP